MRYKIETAIGYGKSYDFLDIDMIRLDLGTWFDSANEMELFIEMTGPGTFQVIKNDYVVLTTSVFSCFFKELL